MDQRIAELAIPKPISCFPRVASKIASDPDKTTTIYRRFDRLSARNLLFLEAEIAELETQLDKQDAEDRRAASQVVVECHSDWRKFERYANEKDANGGPMDSDQASKMKLALKIRDKIKEYRKMHLKENKHAANRSYSDEALALHQTLLNSDPPPTTTVKAMRNWYLGETPGNKTQPTPQIWGSSAAKYEDIHDLLALKVPANQDRLSSFILNNFGVFFLTAAHDGQSAYICEQSVAKFVAILSSVLSAILLFGSITSLYFVHNQYALLGMLGGWTVLFAISVGWLTNARRDQIFAATAAYAAVLVVFASGTIESTPSSVTLGKWTCTES